MSSFDPIAAAVDWLDAYRARSLAIVDFYADDAAVACGCGGEKVLYGRAAIAEYWKQRFIDEPAGDLEDLQIDGDTVVVSYRASHGPVQATLTFDGEGRLARSECSPLVHA